MIPSSSLLLILTRTHALLTQGWCQHEYACRADGSGVTILSPDAARWSLAGALSMSLHEHQRGMQFPSLMGLLRPHLPAGQSDPETWQDLPTTTQADVLALVTRAMAAEEQTIPGVHA